MGTVCPEQAACARTTGYVIIGTEGSFILSQPPVICQNFSTLYIICTDLAFWYINIKSMLFTMIPWKCYNFYDI